VGTLLDFLNQALPRTATPAFSFGTMVALTSCDF